VSCGLLAEWRNGRRWNAAGSLDRLLGHADDVVTDTYLVSTAEDVHAALNGAARLIRGEQVGNVLPFAAEAGKSTQVGTPAAEAR
jgi:hypothetical protein